MRPGYQPLFWRRTGAEEQLVAARGTSIPVFPEIGKQQVNNYSYRDVRALNAWFLAMDVRAGCLHRKDLLLRVLRKMKAVHGDVYGFHPDGYLLPTEYTKFIDAFTRLQPVSAGIDRHMDVGAVLPSFKITRDTMLAARELR